MAAVNSATSDDVSSGSHSGSPQARAVRWTSTYGTAPSTRSDSYRLHGAWYRVRNEMGFEPNRPSSSARRARLP